MPKVSTNAKKTKPSTVTSKAAKQTSSDDRSSRLEAARPQAIEKAKQAVSHLPKPTDVGRFTPSGSKHYMNCPSYYPEWEDPDEDRSAADEGTKLHKHTENDNVKGLDPDAAKLVNMCLAMKKTLREELSKRFPLKSYVHTEHTEFKLPILRGVSNGYIDWMIVVKDKSNNVVHVDIVDWKFGKIAVDPAETNAQGHCYAVSVWHELKAPIVRVWFVQPKRDDITSHEFDTPQLKALYEKLSGAYLTTKLPPDKRPVNLVPTTCDGCGRKAMCPAFLKATATFIEHTSNELSKEHLAALKVLKQKSAETIVDPKVLNALFTLSAPLKNLHDSVKDQVTQMLLAGYDLPDVELKDRDGSASLCMTPNELYAEITMKDLLKGIVDDAIVDNDLVLHMLDVKTPNKTSEALKDILIANGKTKEEASALNSEFTKRLKQRGHISYGVPSFYPKLRI